MLFGQAVRSQREALGISQAEAARRVPISGAHLSRIEAGGRCSADTARAIDRALGGGLAALHTEPAADVQDALRRESARLAEILAAARPGDRAGQDTERLSVAYLAAPGLALARDIADARRDAVTALRSRRMRSHHQVRDLTGSVGYLSGILAYAALDGGHPAAAMAHCEAAWQAAQTVEADQLRAWVRGTQSLILRFEQRYDEALAHAQDGLRYATSGTARARLLAGVGQCSANLGDAASARRALNEADAALDAQRGTDEVLGLFTFSRAKLAYYSGSSLIWLSGGADARRARTQAHSAVRLWEASSDPERSVADEALARVYAATGALQVRDLEGAAADLEPILALPGDRRISWITKRMGRIVKMLRHPLYANDPAGAALLDRIAGYAA